MASPYIELEAGARVIRLTNPDKIYFPGVGATKRDLVEYYLSVGDGVLRGRRSTPGGRCATVVSCVLFTRSSRTSRISPPRTPTRPAAA